MLDGLGKDNVIVNSVTITSGTQEQKETGVADMEELEESEGVDELSDDTEDKAGIHSILVKGFP